MELDKFSENPVNSGSSCFYSSSICSYFCRFSFYSSFPWLDKSSWNPSNACSFWKGSTGSSFNYGSYSSSLSGLTESTVYLREASLSFFGNSSWFNVFVSRETCCDNFRFCFSLSRIALLYIYTGFPDCRYGFRWVAWPTSLGVLVDFLLDSFSLLELSSLMSFIFPIKN